MPARPLPLEYSDPTESLLLPHVTGSRDDSSVPFPSHLLHYRLRLVLVVVHDDVEAFVEFNVLLADVFDGPLEEEGESALGECVEVTEDSNHGLTHGLG